MARKNAVVTYTVNDDGTMTFNAEGAGSFDFNPNERSEEQRKQALNYGYGHKITLGAAIAKADLPEDPVEAAKAKLEGMRAVADRLVADEWSKRGEGTSQPTGIIFTAFAEWAQNMAAKKGAEAPSSEKLREVYDAKSKAEQFALRNVPAIAKIMERIKSEAGSKATAVDTNELLGELGI